MADDILLVGQAYDKFVKSPRLGKIGEIDINDGESRYQDTDDHNYNQQKIFSYKNYLLILNVVDTRSSQNHDVTSNSYNRVEIKLLPNFGFCDPVKDVIKADISNILNGYDKLNDIDCTIYESLGHMYIFAEKGAMCYKVDLNPSNLGNKLAEFQIGYPNGKLNELRDNIDKHAEHNDDPWYYTQIPYRLHPKVSKNILYFNYYQYIISINMVTDDVKIELVAPWIIGACHIYWIDNSSYKFYFSLEPYRYREDITTYLVRSDVGWKRIDANSFNEAFKWDGEDASKSKEYDYGYLDIQSLVDQYNNFLNKSLDTQVKYFNSNDDPNVRIISIQWEDTRSDFFTLTNNLTYRLNTLSDENDDNYSFDRNMITYHSDELYLGIGINYNVVEHVPVKHDIDIDKDHGKHVDDHPIEEDTTPSDLGHIFDFNNLRNAESNNILGIDELFPYDRELVTINELYVHNNDTLYIGQFNGFVTRYKINNPNDKLVKSNGQALFNVPGVIEKISVSDDMVICMHDINNITIWNDTFKKVETLTLEGEPLDISNNKYMLFTYQNNNHVNVYKISDIPDINIDYAIVERDFDRNYYLNIRAKVGSKHLSSNIQDGKRYDITFWYRKLPNVLTDYFPSSNVYKNFYLQLKDINTILTEKQFELDKDKLYYSIKSDDSDTSISNDKTPNKDVPIYKIWHKDAYYYHGQIFFRLRYLLNTEYSLKVKINDKSISIINGNNEQKIYESGRYTSLNDSELVFFKDKHYYDMCHNFAWFNIPNMEYSPDMNITYELYYQNSKISEYDTKLEVSFNTPTDTNIKDNNIPPYTKFLESDGAIINLEDQFISDLDHYRDFKTTNFKNDKIPLLYNSISNIADVRKFDGSKVKINKEEYIGDYVNDESQYGYYDFTVPYHSNLEKMDSRISDVYVNGKRLYRYAFRQMDDLQGKLETFVPVRRVKNIIARDNNQLRSDDEIILMISKRHLYQSERPIYEYTVTNEYEDETQMANSVGISIPANISQSLSANDIRVYIMLKDDVFFHRINPAHYMIEIDRDYGYARVYLYGVNWLLPGDKIVLVTNK